ncbi:hypothetical protein KKD57_02035 [Patescibacteria group bacterium]|nr:hypothetical protein [Patescibacteria group bacterium]
MENKNSGNTESIVKQNRSQTLLFENKEGEQIKVKCDECERCKQVVPKVGTCSDCGTEYQHWKTVEDGKTGFLYFLYKCSGCREDMQKAKRILRPC